MKRVLFGIFFGLTLFVYGQEETTFSDEDLSKYAKVMIWADIEKSNLQTLVKDSVGIWLEEEGTLTKGQYNTLSKAPNLDEADASEEEKASFTAIKERIDGKKSEFKETYTSKIKGDIGAGLYNKLRKALKSDEEVKTRYEAIVAELKTMESADDSAEG